MKKIVVGLMFGIFAIGQSVAEVAYVNDAKIDQILLSSDSVITSSRRILNQTLIIKHHKVIREAIAVMLLAIVDLDLNLLIQCKCHLSILQQ